MGAHDVQGAALVEGRTQPTGLSLLGREGRHDGRIEKRDLPRVVRAVVEKAVTLEATPRPATHPVDRTRRMLTRGAPVTAAPPGAGTA